MVVAAEPILGSQVPTHRLCPAFDYTFGHEAIGLAEMVGVDLDDYQKQLLVDGLGALYDDSKPGGYRWAAREVGIELSRQNGKSVVLQMVALAGLFLFRARKIVYSAHEGQTAMDAFTAIEALIKGCPELYVEVRGGDRGFRHGNGKESITLVTGQQIIFRTRTAGGGRGLSGDLVILDEAQELKRHHIAALFPTLRARPNPQLWYAGSAGDQNSEILGRLIRRAVGKAKSLVMHRWAASEDDDPGDVRTWAKTNPGLGRRIDLEFMETEFDGLPLEVFCRELLGMGDYPREDGEDWVIPASAVKAAVVDESALFGRPVFAADAMPNQEWASIGVAGAAGLLDDESGTVRPNPAGGIHVEVIEHLRGVRWISSRLAQLALDYPDYAGIVIDPKGPLGRMIPDLEELGLKIHPLTAQDVADSCGWIYDGMVNEPRVVRHRGATVLLSAIASAAARLLAGGFAWRRHGQADISPLYSVTFAGYAAATWAFRPATPPASPRSAADSAHRTDQQRRRNPRRTADSDIATVNF